jgi:hypothetical protein
MDAGGTAYNNNFMWRRKMIIRWEQHIILSIARASEWLLGSGGNAMCELIAGRRCGVWTACLSMAGRMGLKGVQATL